jgi:site-specific recombinase XerD
MENQQAIDGYVEWLADRKGTSAIYAYQSKLKLEDLARFVAPMLLLDLDGVQIEDWIHRENRRGEKNAAATMNKDLCVARGFYGYWQRRGLVKADPTIELLAPKIRNKNPRPIEDDLWIAWYEAHHVDQDALLFTGLGYLCGLRRAEILRVRGDMITPRSLVISGLERKGGGEDTLAPQDLVEVIAQGLPHLLPDEGKRFLALLGERARRTEGLLFDWTDACRPELRKHVLPDEENDPQWVYKRIKRWARSAGVEVYKPHDLRHSFVTNLLRCDVPLHLASRLANHSDFAVTSRYAKIGGSELRQLVRSRRVVEQRQVSRFG